MSKRKTKNKSSRLILLVGFMLAAAAVLAFWQNRPGTQQTAPVFETITPLPEHTYDWQYLSTNEQGRKQYLLPDGGAARVGIDVSSHQGEIDWAAVAADGVEFAFIRVGSRGYETGEIYEDERFVENLQNAVSAGVPVGVYFYSQAVSVQEAEEEAEFVLNAIRGYSVDLPVMMDYEEVLKESARTKALTNEARTDYALAFCEKVKQAGYTAMVYSTRSMLLDRFDLARLEQLPIWVADYNETTRFPYRFSMWQYTDRGRAAGIGPDVDFNLLFDWPAE